MTERSFGSSSLDVCETGCRGLWCDWAELPGVDEPNEGFGEALDQALAQPASPPRSARLECTKCEMWMHEHRYRAVPRVLIDECYGCRGFFLDPGELGAIREHQGQLAARDARVRNILKDDPVWQSHLLEVEGERQATAEIARLCKDLMQRIP
jgi:Zn-finger nucleic acid-binding protein